MGKRESAVERPRPMTDREARGRLLAGIPVTQRRLEVAGVSTAVLEGGDGPPVVLLHGGIETGGVVWAPVMSRLTERYRLVVPDVPGLGESDPIDRTDAAAYSDWLAALIQLTCGERPTLIAHSLGGSLAARFSVNHGDLLRGLILYAAPAVGHYRIPLGLLITAIQFNLRPSERANAKFADWAFIDPARTRRRDPEWYDIFMAYGLTRGRWRT
jgi:pimeloyl-ACP methyl ester carboxylesterase